MQGTIRFSVLSLFAVFLLGVGVIVLGGRTSIPRPLIHSIGRPPGRTLGSSAVLLGAYGKLPLSFEANRGQADPEVRFLARGKGYTLFLTATETVLSLREPAAHGNPGRHEKQAGKTTVLRMKLVGVNPEAQVEGVDELPGKSHYFIGNDPAKWRTNVPAYRSVEYRDVYPGVSLVYYGNQRQLEYDFVVAAGADPQQIRFAVEGADRLEVDSAGDLVMRAAGGEVRLGKPLVYQEGDGVRQQIAGSFVLDAANPQSTIRNPQFSRVGFRVAAYDAARPLIIDPLILSYSTFLGGNRTDGRTADDGGNAIAVDSAGNAYVTGFTNSTNFPTASPAQAAYASLNCGIAPGNAPCSDAFVTKFNASGTALLYSTYLGGESVDQGLGIAVDAGGNVYVTGETDSAKFPTLNPLQAQTGGAFVAKLSPIGTLVYSTYLGRGTLTEYGSSIAVDAAGNAYVTGTTDSTSFPTTTGAFQTTPRPLSDLCNVGTPYVRPCLTAFVSKLNASGSALVYSTYLGGTGKETGNSGRAIAVGTSGEVYVTGATNATNFPTKSAVQAARGGGMDAFVTKLDAAGSALVYSTYLGGAGSDEGRGIAVDSAGNAYVTGTTASNNFPLASPLQAANGGGNDVFVTKLNAAGSALVYSTYLGGSGADQGNGIAVDASGNAHVTGETASTNFPTANALQVANLGGKDGFVAKLNPAGSALVYSTYLGGGADETGGGIAVDTAGNAYVTGTTASADFPTASAFQASRSGGSNAFIAKIEVAANNPVLVLNSLSPSVVRVGWPGFTLSVNGSGFVSGSVVRWNGADRPTTFMGWGQLRATISASDVATAGSAQITVFSPGPGGGTSNALTLTFPSATALINDNLAEAIVIVTTPFTDTVDTRSATEDGPPSYPPCSRQNNVWYRFAAPAGGIITADTFGSDYDTTLSVWIRTYGGGFAREMCSDDARGKQSQVSFATKAAESYYFEVGARGGGGTLVFNLAFQAGANPVPTLTSLSPSAVSVGAEYEPLTLTGSGFLSQRSAGPQTGTYVFLGASGYPSGFVSTTQLRPMLWSLPVSTPGTVQVTAVNPSPGGGTSNALTLTVRSAPVINVGGTVNAASFAAGAPVAPGSIASVFGTNFAAANAFAEGVPLPTLLADASLKLGSTLAPLFFVSPQQINFQVPWEWSGYTPSGLIANYVTRGLAMVNIATYAPGIFTTTQTGSGQGAISITQTGEVAAPSGSIPGRAARPAKRGEYLSIYCTGLGPVCWGGLATGAAASSEWLCATTTTPTVAVGGVSATVSFSGLAPGFVGLYQVNVQVPDNAPTGSAVSVVLTIGGVNSNTVTIAVQ